MFGNIWNSPMIVSFITETMKSWKTILCLNHNNGSLTSRPIMIKSSIFQGDSLIPLLFYLTLTPLSSLLNENTYGYQSPGHKITHLFYMDDLKMYAKNDNQQTGLLCTVKKFRNDFKMKFGLEKCDKASFKGGKMVETSDLQIDADTCIKELDQQGTYKYLGVTKGDGIQHSAMKEKVRKEYCHRVRMILKSELNAANRIKAINTLAIPLVT